jgi:DNA-binding MarR family transcriptional regulator
VKEEEPSTLIPSLVADVFQLAGEFRRLGERIARTAGSTQSQWQVLSVASGGPHTVAQIARRLGYARQSVQRTADQLVRDGLARYRPNPDHKNSPFVELTESGAAALREITKAAHKWHVRLAKQVDRADLLVTLTVVRSLCAALE